MPNTFIQLSSGQGPQECRVFIPLLADLIRQDAQVSGVKLIELGFYPENTTRPASCSFAARETVPPDFRSRWEGTVQWIWRSTIRPHHPRKNWFVKVSFFDFRAEDSGTIRASDLKIETCRASGPGGQHVNRTDSAVRIIHLPTGLEASAGEERSQTRNRELAMLRLQEKMHLISEQRQASEKSEMRLDHYRLERGGAVRTFKGMPPRECSR